MSLDSKGQVALFAIMISVVIILLALAFAPAVKVFVDDARNSTSDTQLGLDCSNTSISDYDKAACVAVDSYNWYFFGFLIAGAGAVIITRSILKNE